MGALFHQLLALMVRERGRTCRASSTTVLKGPRVQLRLAEPSDWRAWTSLRAISAGALMPWEPLWPKDATTQNFYMRQWRRQVRRWAQDREYAFLIFKRGIQDGEGGLLGGVTVTDIRRSIYQSATLGYWMGAPHVGNGYMREALSLVLPFAFEQLRLNRLEASVMPENARSLTLLRGIGFRDIGLSKSHMQIEGAWRDQLLLEKTKF